MRMMNPSVMVSRLDLWFLEHAVAGLCFIDSPRVFGILGYLQSKEAVREAAEVGTTHHGAPGPPARPGGFCSPRSPPLVLP